MPSLRKARDREGGTKTAWCADYWQGEFPSWGWWWRESKESNTPPCCPECTKTAKNGWFRALLANKSTKTTTSYTCLKFLKSYTPPATRIRVNGFSKDAQELQSAGLTPHGNNGTFQRYGFFPSSLIRSSVLHIPISCTILLDFPWTILTINVPLILKVREIIFFFCRQNI